ncbi:MAG TPA: radical SAM protein [Elusimicrobiota bacterium]|nr:radical SAM protein [Elusimicrobiota bacterium]
MFLLTMIGSKGKWHQGIASLATYLQVKGHEVSLLEIDRFDLDEIENHIRTVSPGVVAATANSHQYEHVKHILAHIKKTHPDIYTILGGVHVTIAPESIDELSGVDAICRGEGEDPLLKMVEAVENNMDPNDIPNMIFTKQGNAVHKPCNYYVKDLDQLPLVNRNLFQRYRDSDRATNLPFRVRFLFCRGCPYDCSYCCNRTLKNTFPDKSKYVRWPSVDRAIEEINTVSDQFKFTDYVIDDDIFTLNKKWAMEFCNKYPDKHRKTKRFEVNVRIGTVDEEMMRALQDAGCNLIKIGLESGDQSIRESVLGRRISDEMVLETACIANKARIPFHTFNMIGIPGESRMSVFKTIRLNQRIRPARVQVTVFYPYDHTPLGEHCKSNNMISKSAASYFHKSVLKHDRLTRTEIRFLSFLFRPLVYMTYSPKQSLIEVRKLMGRVCRLLLIHNKARRK